MRLLFFIFISSLSFCFCLRAEGAGLSGSLFEVSEDYFGHSEEMQRVGGVDMHEQRKLIRRQEEKAKKADAEAVKQASKQAGTQRQREQSWAAAELSQKKTLLGEHVFTTESQFGRTLEKKLMRNKDAILEHKVGRGADLGRTLWDGKAPILALWEKTKLTLMQDVQLQARGGPFMTELKGMDLETAQRRGAELWEGASPETKLLLRGHMSEFFGRLETLKQEPHVRRTLVNADTVLSDPEFQSFLLQLGAHLAQALEEGGG